MPILYELIHLLHYSIFLYFYMAL